MEENVKNGNIPEDAKVLYEYYKLEEEYNEALMDKYRYFMKFLQLDGDYEEEFEEYKAKKDLYENLKKLRNDKSLSKMNPENAEIEGRNLYGVKGRKILKI